MSSIPVFGTRVPGQAYVPRPSAYALIRDSNGKFAIVQTPVACYLPGGGIEPGETPEQAVIREAREECGFAVHTGNLRGRAIEICFSREEQQYFDKVCYFIEAQVTGREAPLEPDRELLWLTAQEAVKLLLHGSHRWAIELVAGEKAYADSD
jgi:8-oxo-dGTP diphosphatase